MSTEVEDKKDFLSVDKPIAGQNYVCISFVSPEELIQEKNAFKAVKFLQSYFKDKKLDFKEVYEEYENFAYKHADKLQKDFDEMNNFQTNVRGVKVRGVFDTLDAAKDHASNLIKLDKGIHTFVGQMGYWLPFDPCADGVQKEVFQNEKLNELMEKYEENNINRDIFYAEEKKERVEAAREEVRQAKLKQLEEEKAKKKAEDLNEDPIVDMEPEPEPELDEKEKMHEQASEFNSQNHVESEPSPGGSIDDTSLQDPDPWMQRKEEELEKVD